MAAMVLTRLVQGLFIVWMTTTLTFFLIHAAPGEPLAGVLEDPRSTEESRATLRAQYGLDQPLAAQYARFVVNVATGELGDSFTYHRPVADVLADALPRTLLLMGTALVLGFAAGMVLGTLQGARTGGWFDRVTGGAAVLVASLPDFWLALLVLLLFAGSGIPTTGFSDPTLSHTAPLGARVADILKHLILPAGTLAVLVAAVVSRYQRAALIDVLPSSWLRAARARGLAQHSLLFRHALRNALLPTITLAGLAIPALLGGAVFIELTFGWQGMGSMAVQAVGDRDYPLVLAIVLLSSGLVVIGAVAADVAQAVADPRQRHA